MWFPSGEQMISVEIRTRLNWTPALPAMSAWSCAQLCSRENTDMCVFVCVCVGQTQTLYIYIQFLNIDIELYRYRYRYRYNII